MDVRSPSDAMAAGDYSLAEALARGVLTGDGENYEALVVLSRALLVRGCLHEALPILRRASSLRPGQADVENNLCLCLASLGFFDEAISTGRSVLIRNPDNPIALTNLGNLHLHLGDACAAYANYEAACHAMPENPHYHFNAGNALFELGRYKEARRHLYRSIKGGVGVTAVNKYAASLVMLGKLYFAERILSRLAGSFSDNGEVWCSMGTLRFQQCMFDDALRCFERAVTLSPSLKDAWSNLGATLAELRRYEDARVAYHKAVSLGGHDGRLLRDQALLERDLGNFSTARSLASEALVLNPKDAKAWAVYGNVLVECGDLTEAIASYSKAFALNPEEDYLLGVLLHQKLKASDWSDYDNLFSQVLEGVGKGKRSILPFAALGITDDPVILREVSDAFVATLVQPKVREGQGRTGPLERIDRRTTIAYVSPDFGDHPVTYLISEFLECHDRERFRVVGFSLRRNKMSPALERVTSAFDDFYDVESWSDRRIIDLARSIPIDVAIDLAGHTKHSRPRLFVEGIGRVQAHYLGFPGTWGGNCMDFIIGDDIVIEDEVSSQYSERVMRLDGCFQSNDSLAPTPRVPQSVARQALEIPQSAFVFCSLNNNWKITPSVFGCWMRIMLEVPGSILMIYAENDLAERNIRLHATTAQIDPARVLVVRKSRLEDYFRNLRAADLFLDTFPYCAGTTASDCLRCGLPIITLQGRSFSSRMSSSLLFNLGLTELVTTSTGQYTELAVRLGQDLPRVQRYRESIERGWPHSAIVRTQEKTREVEELFLKVLDATVKQ